MPLSEDAKKARHYKKALKDLIEVLEANIRHFDSVAKEPSSPQKGERLAAVMNNIELQKDLAKRFGLGIR